MSIKKQEFIAKGTTCESCAKIIEKQARKIEGVKNVKFNYVTETGSVEFDNTKTDIDKILYKIEEKNYECLILDENSEENKQLKRKMEKRNWMDCEWTGYCCNNLFFL